MAYAQGMDITHVHVTIDGVGRDIDFDHLDVETHPTVDQLRTAVEQHLDLQAGTLRTYEADGYLQTGQVVLRPDAKLGVDEEAGVDVRMKVMNSLLTCPHRDMADILALHKEMHDADPEFYAHMAVWAQRNTKVRDHKEAFVAVLFASDYPELREVAYVLMQGMPAYQIARIKAHVTGKWTTLNVRVRKDAKRDVKAKARDFQAIKKEAIAAYEADKDAKLDTFKSRVRTLFKLPKNTDIRIRFHKGRTKVRDKDGKKTGEVRVSLRAKFEAYTPGLTKNAPRVMRSAVKTFLALLEADAKRFDYATVRQYDALRTLYASYRLKPGEVADLILFKDQPPEGTKRHAMKVIASTDDPVEWAKAVVTADIPYPVAVGLLKTEITPVHLIALINQMSAQELLNNLGSLEERGAMDNPDVKALIEQKLGKATKSKRVDALKAQKAAEVVGAKLDGETRQKLENVGDAQVRATAKIKRNTVLAIDASTSMQAAIDLAKDIGALIAPCCTGEFIACSFNAAARLHDVKSDKKSDWDKALKFVKPIGKTNVGSVVQLVERTGKPMEQFVLVTDEGDNGTPKFSVMLERYRTSTGMNPNVVIVRCGRHTSDAIERGLKHYDFEVDVLDLSGDTPDYYALPNLLPMLAKGSRTELMMSIMEVPLPDRAAWDAAHATA